MDILSKKIASILSEDVYVDKLRQAISNVFDSSKFQDQIDKAVVEVLVEKISDDIGYMEIELDISDMISDQITKHLRDKLSR